MRHFLSGQKIAMGIEWRLLRLWFACAAILGLGALQVHSFMVAAIGSVMLAALFYSLRAMTRKDAFARTKYLRYMRQANVYEPWPQIRRHRTGRINARPLGFGRDRLI
ncbi:hypothetical protein [Ralstonia sp.]|uniref:hypothetical protein n=1 Tax=Ralstonia sp. TaxID=54061 RepID=UPI0031D8FE87